jgi:hypothetical protein
MSFGQGVDPKHAHHVPTSNTSNGILILENR